VNRDRSSFVPFLHATILVVLPCLLVVVACVSSGRTAGADVVADVGPSDVPLVDTPEASAPSDADREAPLPDGRSDAGPAETEAPRDASETDADVSAPPVWGWVSAIEWNDVCDQWYQKTQWFGGVRAYFAVAPEFNRALPHTLGFATAWATDGACTLYDTGIMSDTCLGQCLCLDKGVECYTEDESSRWCGEDEVCVDDPATPPEVFDHGMCVPLPAHYDVGLVTINGLKTPVSMAPDALDRYKAEALPDPNDLFDAGDAIAATTSGGDLAPMAFTARGVAPLELPDNVVRIRVGKPSTIRWTPADPASRVQVVLAIGSHDPNPLGGAIVCDAPDADGQVEVAGSLLDRLIYLGCDGAWMMKCSRITRYSRDLQTDGHREVELFVGSARNLMMLRE